MKTRKLEYLKKSDASCNEDLLLMHTRPVVRRWKAHRHFKNGCGIKERLAAPPEDHLWSSGNSVASWLLALER